MSKGRMFKMVLAAFVAAIIFLFIPIIAGRLFLGGVSIFAWSYAADPSSWPIAEPKNTAPEPFNYFDGKWPERLEKERWISTNPNTPLGRRIAALSIIGMSYAGPILVIILTGLGVSEGFKIINNKMRENQKRQMARRYKPPIYDVMKDEGEN